MLPLRRHREQDAWQTRRPFGTASAMNQYTETAQAIIEHAQAMTALGGRPDGASDAEAERHIHAMRVLAVFHVDPLPDRAFLKELRRRCGDAPGVFVHLQDGMIEFIVDGRDRQRRFRLWNAEQLRNGEE